VVLKKGSAAGFLQTKAASVLRKLVGSTGISESDRDTLTNFLEDGDSAGSEGSGEITHP